MSEDMYNEQIREILKKIRQEQGLTQKDVADVLGVTQAFIGNVETGKNRLMMSQFHKILNVYGYEATFMEGGKVKVVREL